MAYLEHWLYEKETRDERDLLITNIEPVYYPENSETLVAIRFTVMKTDQSFHYYYLHVPRDVSTIIAYAYLKELDATLIGKLCFYLRLSNRVKPVLKSIDVFENENITGNTHIAGAENNISDSIPIYKNIPEEECGKHFIEYIERYKNAVITNRKNNPPPILMCEACGSTNLIEYIWGAVYPEFPDSIIDFPGDNEKRYMGCCIMEGDSPDYECKECRNKWGKNYR